MKTIGTFIGGGSLLFVTLSVTAQCQSVAARDPGPRPADTQVRPVDGLTADQLALFEEGQARFEEAEAVVKDGLGPRMNFVSCSGCHAYPAVGGTSQAANPQYEFVNGPDHGNNKLPFFITANGPTREARFKKTSKGTADGGVHDLFTISGMTGAETCMLTQPDFEANRKNVIFRIPTPLFGGGLIEQIRDQEILDNLADTKKAPEKLRLQITGKVNVVVSGNTQTVQERTKGDPNANGNDGTIARFGWKAQNKSLLIFAGEAYNVEMGISNELFQTEREEGCPNSVAKMPNDGTNPPDPTNPLAVLSDIEVFASFMRFLAPPQPSQTAPGGSTSITNGRAVFDQVGCGLCHTPSLTTDPNSRVQALAGKTANLFSDLVVHRMGDNLEDGISQGEAVGNEFRTAPLWGLGQRLFFLHDGRTNDLVVAIQEHRGKKSEANGVVKQFDGLKESEKQDLLNFLRSL